MGFIQEKWKQTGWKSDGTLNLEVCPADLIICSHHVYNILRDMHKGRVTGVEAFRYENPNCLEVYWTLNCYFSFSSLPLQYLQACDEEKNDMIFLK